MKKSTKKFIIKLIFILFISIFLLIQIFNINIFASTDYNGIGPGKDTDSQAENKVREIIGMIIGVLQTIGAAAAVIMIIYTGILYFTKSNDPKELSNIHEKIKSILIGFIFVIAAFLILTFIKDVILDVATGTSQPDINKGTSFPKYTK